MAELEKDVEGLKGRVNRLENVAYILGGLAVVLGLAGASLFSKLWDAQSKAELLRGDIANLSRQVSEDLGTKVDNVIHERFSSVVEEWGTPWLSPMVSSAGSSVVTKKAEFCALGSFTLHFHRGQPNKRSLQALARPEYESVDAVRAPP